MESTVGSFRYLEKDMCMVPHRFDNTGRVGYNALMTRTCLLSLQADTLHGATARYTVAAVCLALLSLIGCRQSGWIETTSEQGGFRISMPGKPERHTRDVSSPLGQLRMNALLYEDGGGKDDGGVVYLASYALLSDEVPIPSQPTRFFALGRDGALKAKGGRLVSERTLKLGGHPGLEFVAELGSGDAQAVLKCRLFLVGRRYYQLMGITDKDLAGVDRFLRSFRPLP